MELFQCLMSLIPETPISKLKLEKVIELGGLTENLGLIDIYEAFRVISLIVVMDSCNCYGFGNKWY